MRSEVVPPNPSISTEPLLLTPLSRVMELEPERATKVAFGPITIPLPAAEDEMVAPFSVN